MAVLISFGFFYYENQKEISMNAKVASLQSAISEISTKLEIDQNDSKKELGKHQNSALTNLKFINKTDFVL